MRFSNRNRQSAIFGKKQLFFLFLLFFIVFLSILIAIVPEIISTDFENWSKQYLGENYKLILIAGFILGTTILAYLTIDLSGFLPGGNKREMASLTIPWSMENEVYAKEARRAVQKGDLEQALEHLYNIDIEQLNEEATLLASRLAKYRRENRQRILAFDEDSTIFNRISKDILSLISHVEKSLEKEGEINTKIKAYLTQRYQSRLDQKLAGRQPINLTKSPTTEGTSEETSGYFVTLSSDEVQTEIKNIFREAKGRLLIIGVPGAGKTVVMLQLVLALLKEKTNVIPVLLNLASWQSSFVKLEAWLDEILPAEMGVNSVLARKVMREIPLVLLLDGLDEVNEEDRKSCLEAIGTYGADARNQFAIASRKQAYVEVKMDAPVYLQIEVEQLGLEQIKEELKRIGYLQPEALPLLKAIQKDMLLGEVAKTPFYLNVLQQLFAKGMRLSALNFHSKQPSELKEEIVYIS
jgi:hypothetical protein